MNHTKGPWDVISLDTPDKKHSYELYRYYKRLGTSEKIAYLRTHGENGAANARLIAAAPEMVELLEQLTFIVESVAHLQGKEKELLPITDKSRELLGKIKGV